MTKLRPLAPQSFPLVKPDGTPAQAEYAFELDRLVRTLEAGGGSPGVVYGTTAGTAAEGNDSRIVGAAQTADLGSAAFVATTAFDAAGTATGAIAAHVAASDPHPQYLTATEGNAAYQPLDSDLTAWAGKTAPSGAAVGTTDAQALTNKDLTGAGNTFPTFNQNTTGSAATLTTARTIDGQSFNGSANITVIAPGTHAATSKTTPVDADELPLVDSAASNVLKKLTWANLKATLKTYFDTLYQPVSGAWSSWTPTLSSTGGAGFTSASASGTYIKIGKTVLFHLSGTITTVGPATGFVLIGLPGSLPMSAASVFSGTAIQVGATGTALKYTGTDIYFATYNGGATATVAGGFTVSGFYQTT